MGMLWRFLVAVRGPGHATIALLAMLCITFYNGRLYYYNHNIVLMWFVVATAVLAWLAFKERRLRWWALTGLAFGLGALAKYQVAVSVACLLCFWVSQRGWKDPVHRRGLLLATLAGLATFTPHLLWLPRHDFGPIHYALDSSLSARLSTAMRASGAIHWEVDQVLNRALPAIVLLLACVAGLYLVNSDKTAADLKVAAITKDRDSAETRLTDLKKKMNAISVWSSCSSPIAK